MGLIANYNCVSDANLKELKGLGSSEEDLFETVEEWSDEDEFLLDIDKMWDVLHFVLTGVGANHRIDDSPLSQAVLGVTSIENFQQIDDYAPLANLKHLESLALEGDFAAPKILKVQSLEFLRHMKQLRFFSFLTAKVIDKDYSPILELNNLEHLTLKSCKEVKQLYPRFVKLPKLKYGTVLERPELYEK